MRNIKPELVEFIDDKLRNNGSAQLAIKDKNARALLIFASQACVGQTENKSNSGYFVELCQRTVDNYAGKENWCMSFIESMIAYVEVKTGEKSPIISSEHCLTVWRNTPVEQRIKVGQLLPGAIVIYQYGNTEEGHTGFVTEVLPKKMITIEGNVTKGLFSRDGVYQKKRSYTKDDGMTVVGFLAPFKKI